MSFFFDVWSHDGFVLAADVRKTEQVNGIPSEPSYMHKIHPSPYWRDGVKCAIAVCGDSPELSIGFFTNACARGNSLRDIANYFAQEWTDRFAGTEEYSAIHIVGFERSQALSEPIPQIWYWHNWTQADGFLTDERLRKELNSFSNPIPYNNHLPQKIKEFVGKFPQPLTEVDDEHSLVTAFLRLYQPIFSWNGDTSFWRSAGEVVNSGMSLLWRQKTNWTLGEVEQLTRNCLKFLAETSRLLPESTIGAAPGGQIDMLTVTPDGIKVNWANLPPIHGEDELKKACGDVHYEMWMLNRTADLLDEEHTALRKETEAVGPSTEINLVPTGHTSGPPHVLVWMDETRPRVIRLDDRKAAIHNALVESFGIHARELIDFFYPEGHLVKDSDVLVRHFFPAGEWEAKRPSPPEEIASWRTRLNKEIAHLTYDRQQVTLPEKIWPTREIANQLDTAFQVFRSSISPKLTPMEWQ